MPALLGPRHALTLPWLCTSIAFPDGLRDDPLWSYERPAHALTPRLSLCYIAVYPLLQRNVHGCGLFFFLLVLVPALHRGYQPPPDEALEDSTHARTYATMLHAHHNAKIAYSSLVCENSTRYNCTMFVIQPKHHCSSRQRTYALVNHLGFEISSHLCCVVLCCVVSCCVVLCCVVLCCVVLCCVVLCCVVLCCVVLCCVVGRGRGK